MTIGNLDIETFGASTLQNFDLSNVSTGERISGDKKKQYVRFYNKEITESHAVLDANGKVVKHETKKPIKLFINVITEGDKNEKDDVATDANKEDFFEEYKKFMQGGNRQVGTPLSGLSFVSPTSLLELKVRGIFSLEQLSVATDLDLEGVANANMIKAQAIAQLEANLENSQSTEMQRLKQELAEERKQKQAFMLSAQELQEELKAAGKQELIKEDGLLEFEEDSTKKKGKR
jgi:hypothetical protein